MLRAYRQTGPVGSALDRAQARRHQRADVPDPAVPRLPLGQRRLLQRLPDPQHRRVLLDEGRLAGQGRRAPAAGTYRGDYIDQNFDTYSVEYTFDDGTKLFLEGRNIPGCHQEFASYAHGTKGSAVISTNSHTPAQCRIYKGQNSPATTSVWAFPQPEPNPYQIEWDDLIHAIRKDKLYNEVKRGAEASLVTSMGRMAAHTGQVITFDDMLNCKHEFAPDVDKLTMDGPAPLRSTPRQATIPSRSRASSRIVSTWSDRVLERFRKGSTAVPLRSRHNPKPPRHTRRRCPVTGSLSRGRGPG